MPSFTTKTVDGKPNVSIPAKDKNALERALAVADCLAVDWCPLKEDAVAAGKGLRDLLISLGHDEYVQESTTEKQDD